MLNILVIIQCSSSHSSVAQSILSAFHQVEHHRNHHQSQYGGVSQSEDNRPSQWSPENYVVATHKDMWIQIGYQREEVEVQSDG